MHDFSVNKTWLSPLKSNQCELEMNECFLSCSHVGVFTVQYSLDERALDKYAMQTFIVSTWNSVLFSLHFKWFEKCQSFRKCGAVKAFHALTNQR